MTIIVETGLALAEANSYASVADADAFHAELGNATWVDADAADKELALIKASRYLDQAYSFKGRRRTRGQGMAWPRFEVIDQDGYEVEPDEVPYEVGDAACLAALRVIQGTSLAPETVTTAPVKRVRSKLGDLEEETEYVAGNAPVAPVFSEIDAALRGLIKSGDAALSYRTYR
jgi:hypothetical protein